MSYFTFWLNLHRMVEQFLPTQFNLSRREAHCGFSTIMSSFEQQLVVNCYDSANDETDWDGGRISSGGNVNSVA